MSTAAESASVHRRAVPAALGGLHDLIDPATLGALDTMCADMRRICGYQLGLWDADGILGDAGSGKALRPALTLLSTRAAGRPPEIGVPAAVAIELVHNFSLLHDDIMDGDTERRHRPTGWTVFGTSPAILAGDAMLVAALETLVAVGTPAAAKAARRLTSATQRLITGQTADLGFEQRGDVTLDECVRMAADKTAALFSCACAGGAELAGAPDELVAELAAFGEDVGVAFQLVDDLLGIWGAPSVTGKPVLADLRARKKSLPVVAALSNALGADATAAEQLEESYVKPDTLDEDQLREVAELIERAGGRAWASAEARRRYDAARERLGRLDLPAGVADGFLDIAAFIIEREH
jgi:geranylgeranyl diphosphate synthase type I